METTFTLSEIAHFFKKRLPIVLVVTVLSGSLGYFFSQIGPTLYWTKVLLPMDSLGESTGAEGSEWNLGVLFRNSGIRGKLLNAWELYFTERTKDRDLYSVFFGSREELDGYLKGVLYPLKSRRFVPAKSFLQDRLFIDGSEPNFYELTFSTRKPGFFEEIAISFSNSFNSVIPLLDELLNEKLLEFDKAKVRSSSAEQKKLLCFQLQGNGIFVFRFFL